MVLKQAVHVLIRLKCEMKHLKVLNVKFHRKLPIFNGLGWRFCNTPAIMKLKFTHLYKRLLLRPILWMDSIHVENWDTFQKVQNNQKMFFNLLTFNLCLYLYTLYDTTKLLIFIVFLYQYWITILRSACLKADRSFDTLAYNRFNQDFTCRYM